jgi:hypothetical protein
MPFLKINNTNIITIMFNRTIKNLETNIDLISHLFIHRKENDFTNSLLSKNSVYLRGNGKK